MPTFRARLQAAGALAVIVFCGAVITWYFWPIRGVLFQIYALAAIFIAFHACRPVTSWLASTPIVHRIVFYLLLGAMVAGHFTLSTRRYFPFMAWDIFSSVSEQETVFCRELIGTTASGKQTRLVVEQLFPSIIQFDLPPDNEPLEMDRLVAAVAAEYNRQHAADPVREVDLMLMAVKLHLPPGQLRSQPSCELLHRFDLSPAPSS
jgi:hypothetical protein